MKEFERRFLKAMHTLYIPIKFLEEILLDKFSIDSFSIRHVLNLIIFLFDFFHNAVVRTNILCYSRLVQIMSLIAIIIHIYIRYSYHQRF